MAFEITILRRLVYKKFRIVLKLFIAISLVFAVLFMLGSEDYTQENVKKEYTSQSSVRSLSQNTNSSTLSENKEDYKNNKEQSQVDVNDEAEGVDNDKELADEQASPEDTKADAGNNQVKQNNQENINKQQDNQENKNNMDEQSSQKVEAKNITKTIDGEKAKSQNQAGKKKNDSSAKAPAGKPQNNEPVANQGTVNKANVNQVSNNQASANQVKGANEPVVDSPQLPHWRSKYWCQIDCRTGVPCEYRDEVDLRIIVLVATRPDSLAKSLESLSKLVMMEDRLAVDIWIDRLEDGHVDNATETMAATLVESFTNGRACYHTQNQHAFIATQWLDTYRPKKNTKEVVIILEDDIDLSPYAWKWYKALHQHFRDADYIAGFSLKSQNKTIRTFERKFDPIVGPKTHTIVLYNCFQAWAYSPHPRVWREFQDFYHSVRKEANPNDKVNKIDTIDPRINGTLHAKWWDYYKPKNFQESLAHEMFNVYYTNVVSKKPLYTVYQNLDVFTGKDVLLCKNRMEKGLHYEGDEMPKDTAQLLNYWNDDFTKFPEKPRRLTIFGEEVNY